jgi:hypothetical protein
MDVAIFTLLATTVLLSKLSPIVFTQSAVVDRQNTTCELPILRVDKRRQ